MSGMRRKEEKGFTLLELLMVVIIIGILASIALPQYLKVAERTRAAEAIQVLGAVRAAELRYRAQDPNNAYTSNLQLLDTDFPGIGGQPPMKSWQALTVASGANVGVVTVTRSGGAYPNQTMGITFGTGTICGTFVPYFGTAPIACTQD